MSTLARLCVRKNLILKISKDILRQDKRFAGHAKWQNIKHVKAEKDSERSLMIANYVKKMRIAIAEGKSYKPAENLRLAQIIQSAKKKNVPIATITGVLEKAEKSKNPAQSHYVDFRGPGGSIFILKLLTENPIQVKMSLNTIFKKLRCTVGDPKLRNVFQHIGVIVTDAKKGLDEATDDAIGVGAEEVEEIEGDKEHFRFICNPSALPAIVTRLQSLNYNVISMDEAFIPTVTTQLDESGMKTLDTLCNKLNALEEVVSVNHNIEFTEEQQAATKSQ